MQRDVRNYGIQSDHLPTYRPPRPFATREDRVWSVAAHLSTFVNAFTGFLGPVVALVIWLAKRNDSPMVASHALRSVIYQTAWLITIAVGWTITAALTPILIGYLLWPVMILITLAPFVHASVAALDAWRERKVYV